MDSIPRSEHRKKTHQGAPKPLITFITVSYNSAITIEATILSIAGCKALIPCEYIIIDGSSTDGTAQILSRNAQAIDKLLIESDDGIYDAMNKGLRLAKGDFICFVNADDQIIPKGVVKIARFLRGKRRRLDIVASAALAVEGRKETLWMPSALDRFLVFQCPNLCHNAVYARRSVFQKIGAFDSSLKIAADSDWIIRAVREGAAVKIVNTPTVRYSIGGMSSDIIRHANEMMLIAEKTYPLLRDELVRSLFFHLFAWQERRTLFTAEPTISLADALHEASSAYAELSYWSYLTRKLHRRLVARALAKLKDSISSGGA
jgi:glycosyltransferase involved in cell wall biosynthesis